ncbi:hypothetical protein EVAR_39679_1 [Eumeta japonica]|uniref:Uncharacterized protein n=1 Tax=Eumeta variegata TaxID=151549 RepID=A0A4C1Z5P2_EUMVA|nr:hypothetical protein EVAR_39679_1 [Eumeta japonica]
MSVTKAKTIALDASRKSIFLEQAVHNGVGAAAACDSPRQTHCATLCSHSVGGPSAICFHRLRAARSGRPPRDNAPSLSPAQDIVQFMTTPVSDFRTEVACVPQ